MKPDKPPVPDLDNEDIFNLDKETLNNLPGTIVKWLCCVEGCNGFTRIKHFDTLPRAWWRNKWISVYLSWFYCSKHWPMVRKAMKKGKEFEPLSGFKPCGWHYRIKNNNK